MTPATLTVLRPGLLACVQDLGRHGRRNLGVGPGGALDPLALRVANRLVGNPEDAAGLELTMGNCELRFDSDTRIALAGAAFGARLDGRPLLPHWSLPVAAGQVLRLGPSDAGGPAPGIRSWLAVAGGIDVPPVLGSRSTDLRAGFGGHEGRALRSGDRLALGAGRLDASRLARAAFGVRSFEERLRLAAPEGPAPGSAAAPLVLRVIAGPEHMAFTAAARRSFGQQAWRLTPQSSRMGARLAGEPLARTRDGDMLSSGVLPGTIQVPPSGQPIVLLGDAQTTGGYPRIAAVIRADQGLLARAPIGTHLRFALVDAAAALEALRAQARYLDSLDAALAGIGWTQNA